MEDRLSQFVLEQQDLAADGRLRDVQLFARGGERAAVGDRANDLELPEVHAVSIHSRVAWIQRYRYGGAIPERLVLGPWCLVRPGSVVLCPQALNDRGRVWLARAALRGFARSPAPDSFHPSRCQ